MPEDKALRECETQQMGRLQNTLKGQQADRHPFKSVFSEQLPKKKNKQAYNYASRDFKHKYDNTDSVLWR